MNGRSLLSLSLMFCSSITLSISPERQEYQDNLMQKIVKAAHSCKIKEFSQNLEELFNEQDHIAYKTEDGKSLVEHALESPCRKDGKEFCHYIMEMQYFIDHFDARAKNYGNASVYANAQESSRSVVRACTQGIPCVAERMLKNVPSFQITSQEQELLNNNPDCLQRLLAYSQVQQAITPEWISSLQALVEADQERELSSEEEKIQAQRQQVLAQMKDYCVLR